MTRTSTPSRRRPQLVSKQQQPVTIGSIEDRERMIAEAAYYKAEGRGFNGGDPLQDWLDAESEIDRILDHKKTG